VPPPSEKATRRLDFASVEHNSDIVAAFRAMAGLDGSRAWLDAADHAEAFVDAMWDPDLRCFRAGSKSPEIQNRDAGQLPLDVQPWSILAIPELRLVHPDVLDCADRFHRLDADGFTGFDFNDDRDGVWFEGTAHVTTAHAFFGDFPAASALRAELRRAQRTPPWGDGDGVVAASHDAVTSGFDFKLFRRRHIAATAWNVFAQLGFDPYDQSRAPE
jgi:hypothetical protein